MHTIDLVTYTFPDVVMSFQPCINYVSGWHHDHAAAYIWFTAHGEDML